MKPEIQSYLLYRWGDVPILATMPPSRHTTDASWLAHTCWLRKATTTLRTRVTRPTKGEPVPDGIHHFVNAARATVRKGPLSSLL